MTRICPKCSYARQVTDRAPEWQCPSCQVAYSKVGTTVPAAPRDRRNDSPAYKDPAPSSAFKWILAATAIGAGAWIMNPFASTGPTEKISAASSAQPTVILYGTEWCGYCNAARSYLTRNGIQYDDVDIEKTTAGYEEHKRLGGNGVPVFVIGDDVVHGYSEQNMRRSLEPWFKVR